MNANNNKHTYTVQDVKSSLSAWMKSLPTKHDPETSSKPVPIPNVFRGSSGQTSDGGSSSFDPSSEANASCGTSLDPVSETNVRFDLGSETNASCCNSCDSGSDNTSDTSSWQKSDFLDIPADNNSTEAKSFIFRHPSIPELWHENKSRYYESGSPCYFANGIGSDHNSDGSRKNNSIFEYPGFRIPIKKCTSEPSESTNNSLKQTPYMDQMRYEKRPSTARKNLKFETNTRNKLLQQVKKSGIKFSSQPNLGVIDGGKVYYRVPNPHDKETWCWNHVQSSSNEEESARGIPFKNWLPMTSLYK